MEETGNFSWKESKTLMTDKLGRIVSIPLRSSDTTIKGMSSPMDEGEVKDMVIDDAKRRLTSALSRKLHKE